MSSLSLRLPDSLHAKIRELAEQDDVSINQFIATAVAEKAAALLTVGYLENRARRADSRVFDRVLARVPDVAPAPWDEISAKSRQSPKPLRPTSRQTARANKRKRAP
jgi:predicted transcriptional regulator